MMEVHVGQLVKEQHHGIESAAYITQGVWKMKSCVRVTGKRRLSTHLVFHQEWISIRRLACHHRGIEDEGPGILDVVENVEIRDNKGQDANTHLVFGRE